MPSIRVSFIEEVVKKLGDGADLDRLLEEHKMGPIRMVQVMDTPSGKRVLKARRRLGKIQRELLANRFSPFAVNKVIAVLQGEKQELWLRAAMQLLETAEGKNRGGEKEKPRTKQEQRLFDIDQAEMSRLLHLWALGLEYQKRLEREKRRAGK